MINSFSSNLLHKIKKSSLFNFLLSSNSNKHQCHLSREKGDKSATPDTTKPSFFCEKTEILQYKWYFNGIRGKILEVLAFLDAHQPR